MMQLIKITTTPIEYQYQIERSRLEVKQAQNPQARLDQAPAKLQLRQQNTQVRLDSTAMRSSMDIKGMDERTRDAAREGMQSIKDLTGQLAQMGSQLGMAHKGVTVASIMSQRLAKQPQTRTVFIPSVGPEINWQPAQLDIEYQAGNLQTDWQTAKNIMDFVPGKFQMIIKQYPKVQIEYLGGPVYVPPSADPNGGE